MRRTLILALLAVVLQAWWLANIGIAYCTRYDATRFENGHVMCAEWSAPVGRRLHWDGTVYR